MRRFGPWLAIVVGGFALLLGGLAATRTQLHAGGRVLLGWDGKHDRVLLWHRPGLALDGPHAFRAAGGYRVVDTHSTAGQWRLRETWLPARPAPLLTVRVDNAARTRFQVRLRPPAVPAPADVAAEPERLLLLSDMEGEFDRFVALLRAQDVIDDELHWRYGRGHVALGGDFVDRGEHVVPLLWLLYRLEDEARRAGGRVHYVLGNHEQMALAGETDAWPDRMIATAQALGGNGGRRLFAADSVLGQWLRSKPVIARVGDHLLVHGGVSTTFLDAELSIAGANALARPHLDRHGHGWLPQRVQPVLGRAGVTRYRGMAIPAARLERDPVEHLERVLRRFGVRRVAIGHTLVPEVALEHGGRLLRLDVRHARQLPQAALYERGALWRVDARGGRRRLD